MEQESPQELGVDGSEWPATSDLPPIQPARRARCRGCGRDDRTVVAGYCGWCTGSR